MANAEHLAILRQGVAVWNQWRKAYHLIRPNLTGARLYKATLSGANLSGTNLSDADLSDTKLLKTHLSRANLSDAQLLMADLTEATLIKTNLTGANLVGATLSGANLVGATLSGVNIQKAGIDGTVFAAVDLRAVRGLESIHHAGPSTIGIDTIYHSEGNIPEAFLRGCGVPDSMIKYARALVTAQDPIDYYSVFISYSSHDEVIAQRLHADLQARGVRCWFAPHDLEIGAPIVRGIDEAIRLYDKLLIILSEESVTSRWVDFEVSTALHREVEQGRTLLFPIRLDDTVLHTPSGWAAQLRTRHIGDFRGWKDHDRYQAAFTQLLRDLKAKD